MMASGYGKQALMQAELHRRKMQTAQRGGDVTPSTIGQPRRGTRQRSSAVAAPVNKSRPKTSYSRRSQPAAATSAMPSRHPSATFAVDTTTHRNSQDSRHSNAHTFSQVSALTEHSSKFSQTHLAASQGERSMRSGRSTSQRGGGGESIPLVPLRQPSFASTSRTAASSSHQSFSNSVQFNASSSRAPSFAPPPGGLGVPLQRRHAQPATAAPPTRTIATTTNALPPTSTNAQRLMNNLMADRPICSPAVFRHSQQQGGDLRSPCSAQGSLGASQWMQSGASAANLSGARIGRSVAMQNSQGSQQLQDIKALMKQFKEMVAEKTQHMDAKEAQALARIQKKTSDFATQLSSGMETMDATVEDIDNKARAFEKSVTAADELHEARVRFYSDKCQELDGKVTEVTTVIETERDSSIEAIKKTYSSMVTKLQDFSSQLTDNLKNHPVADMIKNFWTDLHKAKGTTNTDPTHTVESSPGDSSRQRHSSTGMLSNKSAQSKATQSTKTSGQSVSRKSSQTKRGGRVTLSPLKIVENPPRPPLKRHSNVLDSPCSSKVSVVTPSNLSRSFKRHKLSSVPTAHCQQRGGKRGSRNKNRSPSSLRESSTALRDDAYEFLS